MERGLVEEDIAFSSRMPLYLKKVDWVGLDSWWLDWCFWGRRKRRKKNNEIQAEATLTARASSSFLLLSLSFLLHLLLSTFNLASRWVLLHHYLLMSRDTCSMIYTCLFSPSLFLNSSPSFGISSAAGWLQHQHLNPIEKIWIFIFSLSVKAQVKREEPSMSHLPKKLPSQLSNHSSTSQFSQVFFQIRLSVLT